MSRTGQRLLLTVRWGMVGIVSGYLKGLGMEPSLSALIGTKKRLRTLVTGLPDLAVGQFCSRGTLLT
ncbi:hypothetical protein NITLEN_10709 [Nitrospira lenta]|uniref:Uncharacterized protein n=1 Tax=Nitrospira lenta TaxID=1436998 RepID=A0A330L342_9BACT|nr:hypothetical protein NITLEN_10709 [Nitrospira lenta]